MVTYDLGWYEIEFTRALTFEAASPVNTGQYKAKKGKRIKVEIVEDQGDKVVVQFSSGQCTTLKKTDFRRLKGS